ncbi:MAG: pitrilysin family protein [Rickettsiales bacterium]
MKEDYQVSVLDNKLTVASAKLPHSSIVAINILVKVGSRHENKKLSGISHVIEHMSFKGTKTRSAIQIAEEFENLGAHFNAYTSRETTVFFVVGLKEHYQKLLNLLTDIVCESVYDKKELEKEKGVILQEIAQSNDNPDEHVFEELQKLCYPKHSMGRPIIGSQENVKAFTKSDILSFVEENYTPQNIIVSVAGNLEHEYVLKTVSQLFQSKPNGNTSSLDEPSFAGGFKLIERDLDQVHLVLSFEGESYHSKDYYTAHMLSSILGDGMSSRLFVEVREKLGLVYAIQSFASPYCNAGTFNVFAGTDVNNAMLVLEKIAEELDKIKSNVNEFELQRAKNRFKSSLMMSREITSQRGSELANDIATYGRYIECDEVISKLENITVADICNLADKTFSRNFAFSAIGKVSEKIDESKLSNLFVK